MENVYLVSNDCLNTSKKIIKETRNMQSIDYFIKHIFV